MSGIVSSATLSYSMKLFGAKGYYVSTVGKNKETIAKYIRDPQHKKKIYSPTKEH